MRLESDEPAGTTQEWPINLIARENSPSLYEPCPKSWLLETSDAGRE
jgi:hypothetical protein